MMNFKRKFIHFDILIPALILSALVVAIHQTPVDYFLASYFFDPSKKWIYRDHVFLESVFHKGGVKLTIGIFLILFSALAQSIFYKNKRRQEYFSFILISSFLTIVSVFLLKRFSNLSCPWNSVLFGGTAPHLSLLEIFSPQFKTQNCFPAGHASGGYAFLSLYYGHCLIYGERKFRYLVPGLALGLIFGITQQMRGAHFLSHDIATIVVSLFSSWVTIIILDKYNNFYGK